MNKFIEMRIKEEAAVSGRSNTGFQCKGDDMNSQSGSINSENCHFTFIVFERHYCLFFHK